jgi:signal transduction histidine kinase
VAINRTSFVQLLLNLATNAAAAMNHQGELSILLDDDVFEPLVGAVAPPIRFARLRVTDTGCGMTKATLDRVFEPFFTTKAIGQGTGLGMPVVYGLVQAMRGTIALRSESGRGTTVTILIPQHFRTTGDGNDFGD